MKEVVALFEWNEIELSELKELKGAAARDSVLEKQYRHITYLYELAYAEAIEPKQNITSNHPTCEWQLRYYGEKDTDQN
jgi:hypothetical protein